MQIPHIPICEDAWNPLVKNMCGDTDSAPNAAQTRNSTLICALWCELLLVNYLQVHDLSAYLLHVCYCQLHAELVVVMLVYIFCCQ